MESRDIQFAEGDAPSDEVRLLIRELASAHAEVRSLRAQLNTNTEQSIAGSQKARVNAQPLPTAFQLFDQLPDEARVNIKIVALLDGCSIATAWRRVRAGILPQPEHVGGTTRWRVGTLRSARTGSSVQGEGGTDRKPDGPATGSPVLPSPPKGPSANQGVIEDQIHVAQQVRPETDALHEKLKQAIQLADDRAEEIGKLTKRIEKLNEDLSKRNARVKKLKTDLETAKRESRALKHCLKTAPSGECEDVPYTSDSRAEHDI
ncbi:hypothetical protein PQQ99_22435 [Paraburkholderia sediminicola]|uniref:helix-turn-helix transcriptional regulator n=1 Tax=Paraburkholderia sediminicola TaxID=458836 RepID=UPI0038B79938